MDQYILQIFTGLLTGMVNELAKDWTNGTTAVLQVTVFRAFTLSAAAQTAWSFSRDISLAFLVLVLIYGVFRGLVAAAGGAAVMPLAIVPRALVGAVGIILSFQLVQGLLWLNNSFVAAVLQAAKGIQIENLLAAGISGGLLFLIMTICFLLGVIYLVLTYYVRAAEIILLTALLPFGGALWVLEDTARIWGEILGELLVLIFYQSGQALVFWLFLGLGVGQANAGIGATLDNYMTALACIIVALRVPGLLRGFVGAKGAVRGADWLRPAYLASSLAVEAVETVGTALGGL